MMKTVLCHSVRKWLVLAKMVTYCHALQLSVNYPGNLLCNENYVL